MENKEQKILEDFISQNNLKNTHQRRVILKAFLETDNHISAEDLHNTISDIEPKITLATIYRTLALLTKSGLASELNFGDGQKRFEQKDNSHHDHMICTKCGEIIEFIHPQIEKFQEKVAMRNEFTITSHRLNIFGVCKKC